MTVKEYIMSRIKTGTIHMSLLDPDKQSAEEAAKKLKNMIEAELPGATVKIGINLGLCSYYAEKGGLLVGFEKT